MAMRYLGTGVSADSAQNNCVRFGHLLIWPERGLIRVLDERTGEKETITVHTTGQRLRGLSDMVKNSRRKREKGSFDQFDDQNIDRIQRMIEDVIETCSKAKVQGMPSDPSARRDLARRLPKTFVVPNVASTWATL
jgi:hypothetical protein